MDTVLELIAHNNGKFVKGNNSMGLEKLFCFHFMIRSLLNFTLGVVKTTISNICQKKD